MGKLKKILLVEDDQITNFINKRLIAKVDRGIEVNIASNGLEGINLLEDCLKDGKGVPELIFLDINMPVMDGFEFLEKFQALSIEQKVTIVMLTTSNHIKDLDQLFRTGNSDIIAKPLTEEKFLTVLDKYFENSQYGKTA